MIGQVLLEKGYLVHATHSRQQLLDDEQYSFVADVEKVWIVRKQMQQELLVQQLQQQQQQNNSNKRASSGGNSSNGNVSVTSTSASAASSSPSSPVVDFAKRVQLMNLERVRSLVIKPKNFFCFKR